MKKLPKGVYVEGDSVGIDFRFKGERYHEILKPNGISLSNTPPNHKYASDYRAKILAAFQGEKMGGAAFNIEEWLPNSKRVQRRQRSGHTGDIQGLITAWLNKARQGCAHSTMIDFERAGREFIQRWGTLAPAELTVLHIKDWIGDSQEQGRTRKTIRNMAIVLRGALDDAEEANLIDFNPLNKIRWKTIRTTESERIKRKADIIYPFDLEEITSLLASASSETREFLIMGFGLGPRLNESFGLAWEDLDLERGKLHFRFGRVKHRMTTLKTDGSDRHIDLAEFPHVWAALRRQKALTYMYPAVDLGQYGKRHFVFYNPLTKKPFEDSDEFLDRIWIPLLRKAGGRYRGAKQMRHTFAIHHRVAGRPDLWIAGIMGHTTTQMLEKHYGRKWPSNAGKMGQTDAELQQFWAKVA